MADVFDNALVVNASPHVRDKTTTATVMQAVCVALVPCIFASVFYFGAYALILVIASIVSALLGEIAFQVARKRPLTVGDGSAVVTGLILGLNLPVTAPLYLPLIGGAFATVLVKMTFGGIGRNFANPAAAARVFLMLAYTSAMTKFVAPIGNLSAFFTPGIDGVTSATPLGGASASLSDLFFGNVAGVLGETSKLAILIGFVYLLQRRIVSWHIPCSYVVSFAFLTFLTEESGRATLSALLSGGILFGAVFMATDYATSPKTVPGRMLYAFLLGGFTWLIRNFTAYNEGVAFSILIVNLLVPLIDRAVLPKRFGSGKKPYLEISLYAAFFAMLAAAVVCCAVFW